MITGGPEKYIQFLSPQHRGFKRERVGSSALSLSMVCFMGAIVELNSHWASPRRTALC